MKKSPTPLGLNGIYLGPGHHSILNGVPESKSKQKDLINSTKFIPVNGPDPSIDSKPLTEGKSPPPKCLSPRNLSPALPLAQFSSLKKEGIAGSNIDPKESHIPPSSTTGAASAVEPSPSVVANSPGPQKVSQAVPTPQPSRKLDSSQKNNSVTSKPISVSPPSPPPQRSQKNLTSRDVRKNSPPRHKSPKPEKDSGGGQYVGKTLRSQKMEMRIRAAAVESEETDESPPHSSPSSSESEQSSSESTPSSNLPSRSKIYEPDLATYGISNGTLAGRTKRMLEKQAKIEGIGRKGSPDNSQGNGKNIPSEIAEGQKESPLVVEEVPLDTKSSTAPPAPNTSVDETKLQSSNLFPYPYPYPPYGYPPYPGGPSHPPSPFGFPPGYPMMQMPGYPPSAYPGYYPYQGLNSLDLLVLISSQVPHQKLHLTLR
jgi:hypothetical protein